MARDPLPRLAVTDASLPPEASDRTLAFASLVSLRADQWTKNLIVFAGLIFGQQLGNGRAVAIAAAAFGVFCALSSAMYLVNDLVDRPEDRRHPTKSHRPIASGALPPTIAWCASLALGVGGLSAAFWLRPAFGLVSLGFVALLTAYSVVLKHVVIVDVLTIAAGFVLRAVAGAVVIGVPISQWLLVCTVLLALFLGFSKRRQELRLLGPEASRHRRILEEYTPQLLDQLISIAAAATLVSYAFYTMEPATVEKFGTSRLTLTLPFPVYGVFRYLYLVYTRDGGGSPSETLLWDRPLLTCVALWVAAIVLIVYRPFGP